MQEISLGLIFTGIGSVGTFLIGVSAVVGVYKYFRSLAVANETLYGEEANERYSQLKHRLNKCSSFELEPLKYGGSEALKTPRLEIRKLSSYSKTTSKEWRKYRAIIKYYYEDNCNCGSSNLPGDGKNIKIRRWLI